MNRRLGLSILRRYRRDLHYPVPELKATFSIAHFCAGGEGGGGVAGFWRMEKGMAERAVDGSPKGGGRGAREGREACAWEACGGFFRLSKYETILYRYLLPPERFFFFFGRGTRPCVKRNGLYTFMGVAR